MDQGSNTKDFPTIVEKVVPNSTKADLLESFDLSKRLQAKQEAQKPLRAVIYVRVSTKPQADEDKSSIPNQLEKCHAVIKSEGWTFIKEYTDEGISGHLTQERVGLQSMLRDAEERKFDLIVVKDYDRFARNKDAAGRIREDLKKLHIQVYSINTPVRPKSIDKYESDEDDSSTIMESISDLRSDLERNQIRRRMKDGKIGVAKAGNIPNRVPYGYSVFRYLEGTKVKRRIDVDEESASRVRYIFSKYTSGVGDRKITIEMNNKGWRSPMGGAWSTRAVKYILSNPVYVGYVLWGWRHAEYSITQDWIRRGKMGLMVNGNHQPLIDEVTFRKAQEIRNGRRHHARGGAERSFGLLTGIAKCIRCGMGVSYVTRHHKRTKINPNWHNTTTHEYICTGYKYKGICSARVMSATKLEGEVLNHIKNLYSHPKVQEKIVYDGKDQDMLDNEKELQRLNREISMIPEKKRRHEEAYEKGAETLEQFQLNINRLDKELKKNNMERDGLMSICSLTAQKSDVVAKLVASMHDFDNFWEALEFYEKKLILRSIIKEIRAGEGKVEIDFIL